MKYLKIKDKIINVFEMKDIDAFINKLAEESKDFKWVYKKDYDKLTKLPKRHYYLNYPISFDIETSSFYNDDKSTFYTNEQYFKEIDDVYNNSLIKYNKKFKDKEKAKNKAILEQVKHKEKFKPCACMYIWQMAFGVNDLVIIGRTWEEWFDLLTILKDVFELSSDKELIIYVHNLHYEFSFIKNYFKWNSEKSFLTNEIVYYADTALLYCQDDDFALGVSTIDFSGFLFKDSLCLAGVKEENLPKIMNKYSDKAHKLVGNLDYNKVRHSKTELTDEELLYCIYDVILLNWYIQEKIEEADDEKITNIAITSTGEIRRECRNRLFYTNPNIKSKKDSKYKKYKQFIENMSIDYATYQQIRRAYSGGFTHANSCHIGKVFNNEIMSMDLASSYPSVMVAKKFPMSPYKKVEVKSKSDFNYYIENYACLFDIRLRDIRPRLDDDLDFDLIENIISVSKCEEYGRIYPDCKPIYSDEDSEWYKNNGRLRYADEIYLTINEIDFINICNFYDFNKDEILVSNFRIANKGYLPKDLILYVLELFKNKTQYKPWDGSNSKEDLLYKLAKRYINGLYGMISTDPIKESFILDDANVINKFHKDIIDDDKLNKIRAEELNEYLEKQSTFLCYQWSHVLTSWARYNLFQAIMASGTNHVYSDTDSEKFIKNEQTLKFRDEFNKRVDDEMNACFKFYNIPLNSHKSYYIKDGKKIEKCLGYFEIENKGQCYKKFVTCGAKRYLCEDDEEIKLTVAGLSKDCITYLIKQYGDDLWEKFGEGDIEVPREFTGKLSALYIDFKNIEDLKSIVNEYSCKGIVIDYKNNVSKFAEMSCIHLEPVSFDMKICEDFDKICSSTIELGL